jgi:PAS domain S-box-containing protein
MMKDHKGAGVTVDETQSAPTQTLLEEAETRTERAEARTKQADTRTEQAVARTEQANTRTEQAEARTELANTRTEQAEARTEQANTRTEQAEARTEQANTRTEQAEARTEQADTRSEHAIRASELRYRRLFEAAKDGILILDVDTGRISDVNPFLTELLGFSHSEMVGKTVGELSPFKDIESNQAMLEQLQQHGYVRYEDLPLETRDGRRIAVEFVSNVYEAGDKKVIQCNVRDITKRKQAEMVSLRLAAIVESSGDSIIGTDLTSIITSWNKGAEKVFGYTASEMMGTSVLRLIPADRQNEENHILGKIKHGESVEHFETLRQTKDKRLINVSVTTSPIKDATGKVIGLSKVARDITERKRAEEARRASDARLKFALQTSRIGAWELSLQDNTANRTLIHDRIFGYRKLLPLWTYEMFLKHVLPEDRVKVDRSFREATAARGHWDIECRIRRADGEVRWIWAAGGHERDPEGKPVRMSGIVQDITERKQIEEQLKASFKEVGDLKSAVDEHAIVATTDSQGKITYVNDKFCAISKYSREELLGKDHRIINSSYHPKEFIRDLWTTITQGHVWHGEIKNKAKDGSFYWVDTTIVPFLNDQGKPRQYVAIRADITERKAAEEKIRRLNAELEQRVVERTAQLQAANQELEAYSYSVSHDLRAPLRHVLGFVDLLQKDAGPTLSEKNLRHLTTISDAAKRMGNLIDDLLAFSRLGRASLQKADVNLDELVQETLGEFQEEMKARKIVWNIHPLPPVQADRALLRMVLVNLISNAVKFTGARAEAKIEIGCTPNGNGETVIFIRDNGAGFDPQYTKKLFGVFQRLHSHDEFEGTGIGLANVQRIIHRHGGRAWAEGIVDGGATFYFSIPKQTAGIDGH